MPLFYFMPVIIRYCYECQELQGDHSVPYLNLTDYDIKSSSPHLKFLKLEIWKAEGNGSLPLLLALGSVQGTASLNGGGEMPIVHKPEEAEVIEGQG